MTELNVLTLTQRSGKISIYNNICYLRLFELNIDVKRLNNYLKRRKYSWEYKIVTFPTQHRRESQI